MIYMLGPISKVDDVFLQEVELIANQIETLKIRTKASNFGAAKPQNNQYRKTDSKSY
jgi:hypothetical protein